MLKYIKKSITYAALFLICLEIALWIIGYRPYSNKDYKVISSPNDAFLGDSIYGIRLNPGTYDMTLNDAVHFTTNHENTFRRHIPGNPKADSVSQIHLLGCSFTYGYGVDDDKTFAALLQASFPNQKVINHAVIGHGTVQSLLQLQREDFVRPNDHVILCFSSHHFIRNTLSQSYRSSLSIGFQNSSKNVEKKMENARFPLLRSCSESITYVPWDALYDNWIGREYSTSINFAQNLRDWYLDSDLNSVETTACLFEQMHDLCTSKGASFSVIFLDESIETDVLATTSPIAAALRVNFDFTDHKYTNLPYDSHPNEDGHALIHAKILPVLEELLSK